MQGRYSIPKRPNETTRHWHVLIADPNQLLSRVPPYGGVDPERAFLKAKYEISRMSGLYVERLGHDLGKLGHLAEGYRREPCRETLLPIFQIVHNMRGQGATFNYPLITEIGKSLCWYCSELPMEAAHSVELVMDHIHAMKQIYRCHLAGRGDDLSQAVSASLREAVALQIRRY